MPPSPVSVTAGSALLPPQVAMSSQGLDVSGDRLIPELRAQKLSPRTNVTTLQSLKGHGGTAVVSPALTHSFSLYFISGIPVEQKKMQDGSAVGLACVLLFPGFLSMASVHLCTEGTIKR